MKRKSFLQNLKSLWCNQKPKQEKKLFMWRKGTNQLLWNISLLSQGIRELKQQRQWWIQKRHLKSEFPLPQTLLCLFHLVQFVRCWWIFLEFNSKGLYQSSEKEKGRRCLVFTFSTKSEIRQFHVVVVHWRQRNVQKSVMRMQSCCFANQSLLFFCPLLLPLSLPLLKLPIFSKIAL